MHQKKGLFYVKVVAQLLRPQLPVWLALGAESWANKTGINLMILI